MQRTFWFKVFGLYILIFSFVGLSFSQARYQVKLFLLEDCKITQAYIPELRKLHELFQCDSINFTAYFSSPSSELAAVLNFVERYTLSIPIQIDTNQLQANEYDITVMPEVVVIDTVHKIKIYQGRIDNLFAGLGKRRSRATEHDLKDVLNSLASGKTVISRKTDAFGCILTRYGDHKPK